jgi:hypothetical protein
LIAYRPHGRRGRAADALQHAGAVLGPDVRLPVNGLIDLPRLGKDAPLEQALAPLR